MNPTPSETAVIQSGAGFPERIIHTPWLAAAFLLIITFLAYIPAIREGGFIFEDDLYAANPVLAQPGGLFKIWTQQLPKTQYFRGYPVVYTSFWLERRLWGLQPMGYHLVNVALHAINAILVWLILKRMRFRGAWAAAAVFALHPVHVDSVAWISERKNVLSGMFYLLALGGYQRFEENRGHGWYFGSLGLFIAALLSKPVTCTLPVVLLLLRWQKGMKFRFRDLADLLPFFLLSIGSGLATLGIEIFHLEPELQFTLVQRVLLAARALWFYPIKLIWPSGLTYFYERREPDVHNFAQWLWVLGTLAFGVWLWRARHRLGRGFLAGIGFYLITIFPLLGFVVIGSFRCSFVGDHYQYLASLGLIAACVGSVASLLCDGNTPAIPGRSSRNSLIGVILCFSALVVLGTMTWLHSGTYKSNDSILLDSLKKNPYPWQAHVMLGNSLLGQGRTEEAVAHYCEALQINPGLEETRYRLGTALIRQGKVEEAIAQYREALRLKPNLAGAHDNWGIALAGQGKQKDAIAQYREALRIKPSFAEAHENWGIALDELGKAGEAIAQYREALRINPDFADAHYNLGADLAGQGNLEEAIAQYREAVRLKSDFAKVHDNWGIALARQGKAGEAIAQYREALRLKPDFAEAHNNWGVALSGQGKIDEAIVHYRKALQLDPGYAEADYNLGIDLASQGKVNEASTHFKEALRLKPELAKTHS